MTIVFVNSEIEFNITDPEWRNLTNIFTTISDNYFTYTATDKIDERKKVTIHDVILDNWQLRCYLNELLLFTPPEIEIAVRNISTNIARIMMKENDANHPKDYMITVDFDNSK